MEVNATVNCPGKPSQRENQGASKPGQVLGTLAEAKSKPHVPIELYSGVWYTCRNQSKNANVREAKTGKKSTRIAGSQRQFNTTGFLV